MKLFIRKHYSSRLVIFLASTALFISACFSLLVFSTANADDFCDTNYDDEYSQMESNIDGVPTLNITLNGVTLEQINAGDKKTKYYHNTVETDNFGEPVFDNDVEIKGRGNSTWSFPKKPYQIKFSKKTNLFNLGKSKKWVLLANAADTTKMRNDVSFHIASMLNMKFTLSGQYINLYVDGKYIGLYWLTHKVEVGSSSVDLDDNGVIVEMDGFPPDDIYFKTKREGLNVILADTAIDSDDPSEIQKAMDSFESAFDKFEDASFSKDWNKLVASADVDSLAEYVILAEITKNGDAYANSFHFYRNDYDDIIHCGPAWDFDHCFGNYPFGTYTNNNFSEFTYDITCSINNTKLMSNLLDIPEFRKLVENKYKKDIKGRSKEIVDYAGHILNYIYNDAVKDSEKWGYGDVYAAVDNMQAWIQQRIHFLDYLFGDHEQINDGFYRLYTKDGSYTEEYYIENLEDGFVRLNKAWSNNILTVTGDGYSSGSTVANVECKNEMSQEWLFTKHFDNHFLMDKRCAFVFDMTNSSTVRSATGLPQQAVYLQRKNYDVPNVKVDSSGDGVVTLKWDAIKNATKYAVAELKDGQYKNITTSLKDTKITISDLANNVEHQFLVQAYVNNQWTIFSLANNIKVTLTGTVKPNVISSSVLGTSINLSWNKVPGAEAYAVAIVDNKGHYNNLTTTCKKTSFKACDLDENTTYTFLVQSYSFGRWSPFTSTDYYKTKTDIVCPVPKVVSTDDGTVTLSWNSINNATKYAVAERVNGVWTPIDNDIKTNSFTIENLANEYKHWILVQSYVDGKWSSYADEHLILVQPSGKTVKPKVEIDKTTSNSITITWNAVPGAKCYAVAIKNSDGTFTNYTLDCKNTKYTITGLRSNTTYNILVQANIYDIWSKFNNEDIIRATTKA